MAISTAAILQANRDVAQAVLGQAVDNLGAIDLMQANADTNAAQLLAFQLSIAVANTSTANAAAKQLAKNLQNNRQFGASEDGAAINRVAFLARIAEIGAGGNVDVGSVAVSLTTILTNLLGSPTVTNVRMGADAIETVIVGASSDSQILQLAQRIVPGSTVGPFRHGTLVKSEQLPDGKKRLILANSPADATHTHPGIDLPADRGTPIKAIAKGEVVDVNSKAPDPELGYMVRIKHDQPINSKETYSLYLHLDSPPSVDKGAKVEAGGVIGLVGTTGNSGDIPPRTHRGSAFLNPVLGGRWLEPTLEHIRQGLSARRTTIP